MNTTPKKPLKDLPQYIRADNGAFICCASFEDRSCCVPFSIKNMPFNRASIFAADDCHPTITDRALIIKDHLKDMVNNIITTKTHNPLFTANAMAKEIRSIIEQDINNIIIDISTFTHEMLLILLKSIFSYDKTSLSVTCIYTSAKKYSIGDEKERKWLSKGCKEVRSVFGFPGNLVPGRPTCLMVLVGFEHERATRMIIEMDPEYLLLGKGLSSAEHLTHRDHLPAMDYFQGLVADMVSSRGNVSSFEFSCRNLERTIETINSKISEFIDYNFIIVPLNTKISTVAVALSALKNRRVQVCYAEPETYNFEAYSEPDDKVTIFKISGEDGSYL